jgi:hypothetical protein
MERKMTEISEQKIIVDDTEYSMNDLSENAKAQLESIKFVDTQIQQLQNEWAVCDTARIGYTKALHANLKSIEAEN